MKMTPVACVAVAALVLVGCGDDKTGAAGSASSAPPAKTSAAPKESSAPKAADTAAPKSSADKPDYDAVADAVKFTQGAEKDGTFAGKLENTSKQSMSGLEYDAFAYEKDGKLLERVTGKLPSGLEAGKSADIEVGPFKAAKGKKDVSVEVVVAWMNVNGTSWQRPVPKDRPKGGPNNMLKK